MAYHAACGGHIKLLDVILPKTGDISCALEHAFQGAAEHGHVELAHWCWNRGARGIQDFAMAACRGGKISMVIKALESGAKPRETWLYVGVLSGSLAMVNYLIELLQAWEMSFNVDLCLQMAASTGIVAVIWRFVVLGASLSRFTYKAALESAARSGALDAFLFIYQRGDGKVKLNLALEVAACLGYASIVRWIVRNTSVEDECLFHVAACAHDHGMNDIVEYLLQGTLKVCNQGHNE
jgi:hypothetical protein